MSTTDTATALKRVRSVVRRRRARPAEHAVADASEIVELLRCFGRNSASFVVGYPAPWRRFLATEVDGAACYLEARRTAVCWADPLCPEPDTAGFLAELKRTMRGEGRRVLLVPLTEQVANAAMECGYGVMKIGEEPIFELSHWARPRGRAGKTLRGHLNRARRAGIEILEYRPDEGRNTALEAQLLDAQRAWMEARDGQVPRSVLMPAPLSRAEEKRYFIACRHGRAEAFVSCVPVYARDGWLLEDLTRRPAAAAGATELLTIQALERLRDDGASVASLGLTPGRGLELQPDVRVRALSRLLRWALARLDGNYDFDNIGAWNAKFRPSAWEPRFAAFSPRWPTPALVRGAMSALGLGED